MNNLAGSASTRRRRRQWAAFGLVMLALWAYFSFAKIAQRDALGDQEATRLMTQARVIESNLARQLDSTNRILNRLAGEFAPPAVATTGAARTAQLQDLCDAMPGVRTLSVLDADGKVLASNRVQVIGENFSHRQYFGTARQSTAEQLIVSPPFTTVLKAYVINVTRVMRRPDGAFGGVVTASLDPDYFKVLLRSVFFAPDMRAAITHGDGQLFMVVPERPEWSGTDLSPPGSFFSRHRDSGHRETLLTGSTQVSGDQRMMAQLTFQPAGLAMDKPLMIAVSRQIDAVYGSWRQEMLVEGGILLLFSLVSAFGLSWYQRRQRQDEDNFRSVVQGAPHAIVLVNADGTVAYCNPAFTQLFGYTTLDVPAIGPWWEKAYPDPAYRAEVMAAWQRQVVASTDPGPLTRTFRVRCADGGDRDIRFVVARLHEGRTLVSMEDVTAELHAEAALRDSGERLQRIFEQVPTIAVQGYSPEGVVRYWNSASERLYGYSKDEAIGADRGDLIIPEAQRDSARQAVLGMTASGQGHPAEEVLRRTKGGEVVPVYASYVVVNLPGQESQLYCLDVDLSERKRAEEALTVREQLLSGIFDTASVAIFLIDRRGIITHANQRMAEMFACPMASLIGSEYVAHVHPAEREVGRQRMMDLLASAVPSVDLERHYWRDDGVEFWGHLTGRRFQGAHGEELGLLGVIADIDTRKQATEALVFSQRQFRDLVDSTAGIVWEGDARTFEFTFVSQEAERLLGYPVEEWKQPGFWVANLHPDDRNWAPEYCASCTSRLEAHDFEYRFIARDGRTVWLRDIVKVVEENGQPRWLRGVMVDITEQKRATERHTQVIETSMDGFIVIGADGHFKECNDAVCAMTGYSRKQFLERSISDLDASERPEQLAAHLEMIARAGFDRFETVWRRQDGSVFDIELTASHLSLGNESCCFVRDITLLKQHQRELHHIAHYDALTGVPNRTLLADRMNQGVASTRRGDSMMAVCYLDLDGFKPVNDKYGHAAGDRVLVEIAGRLRDCLRGSDTVARMGGDEFVLLLLGLARIEECEAALARILKSVAEPLSVAGDPVTISASLGVALYPRDDVDVDTLLRHADQSMYLAKQSGKNRYHLFDPENDRVARDRSERLARIRLAIDRREFVLYYQPQVDMQLGRVVGMEALIRWQHPERGLLPPADFLSVVEDSDLIVDIGDWVIATALQQIDSWQRAGVELNVGVNIAARHLLRGDFVDRLKTHLAACPSVAPQRLDLEVLETAALEDIAHVSGVIRDCQALGVSYSLDDFGTGYSSLTYLKSLPAETLKIDQTFVRDMLSDSDDRAIVQGVIGLAKVFQREVIAEGVETSEHGSVLLALGCAKAQGYGIARPMPAAAVADWVTRWQPDPAWQSVLTSAVRGDDADAAACPTGIPSGHKKNQSTPLVAAPALSAAPIDLTES